MLGAEIQLSISLPRGKQGKNMWQFGRVEEWKVLPGCGSPGGVSFPVHHIRPYHRCPMIHPANEDTSLFTDVIQTLKYTDGRWAPCKPADIDNWTRAQRACHMAFVEEFYNSSGRHFMDALLRHYLKDSFLDIVNIGGGSPNNVLLHKLQIMYTYYPVESDRSTSSEDSPKKNLMPKDSPEKDSPEKDSSEKDSPEKDSSEKGSSLKDSSQKSSSQKDSSFSSIVPEYTESEDDGHEVTRTPVVDNLVRDCKTKLTYLIVSVKHGTIRSEHVEQLKHELLSMVPTAAASSGKQRVCGVLICQHEVLFYLAEKSAKKINIFQLESFDLTTEKEFSAFVNYMTALFKYSRQVV
ncbi:PREDICTED: uncharacterized protein LOC106819339 [Priapulus caudatus]|uniref:Uncharacterized protein LOC106819339 n=1 Tax=Priapulus caudatus TaxID=37621 RepID=A0ABM1F4U8_PRICU|nr:PREDICTED: uncharacterized protein LOC106819339 [Priapulus caudatus]